ncbi:MAG: hypothetical protein U1F56_18980 [Rubrivivax sp.]
MAGDHRRGADEFADVAHAPGDSGPPAGDASPPSTQGAVPPGMERRVDTSRQTEIERFEQVAEPGSLTHAAPAMNRSTAATGRQLAAREGWRAARQGRRDTRRFHLTDVGDAFDRRCERPLADRHDRTRTVVAGIHRTLYGSARRHRRAHPLHGAVNRLHRTALCHSFCAADAAIRRCCKPEATRGRSGITAMALVAIGMPGELSRLALAAPRAWRMPGGRPRPPEPSQGWRR